MYALAQIHRSTASNPRPVWVDDSDVVRLGQLIEGRVAKARAHQCAAKENDGVTLRITVIRVRNSIGRMSTCVRVWWKNVAFVETDVAEKVENRHDEHEERRKATVRTADDKTAVEREKV